MLTRTDGIVLKTKKYGEADLIVTYLTQSRGIISAFAKSPRKTKSRFGSSLEPLTHAKIALWGKEQSMPKITQSDILNPFQHLRENFEDFGNILKLIEILLSLIPEGVPNRKLFFFLLNTMILVESSKQKQKNTLYLISLVRLLIILGYAPWLKRCGKCGDKSLDFYPGSGTTLCRKCVLKHNKWEMTSMKLTHKVVNFYSHITEWPAHTSNRLKPHPEIISELSELLDKHLTHILRKQLRSSEFLKKVK